MSSMAIKMVFGLLSTLLGISRPKIRARFPEWTIRHEACLQEGRYRNATCKQSLTRSTSEHRSSWSSRIRCVQHLHPCTRIVKLTQDDSSLMARRRPPVLFKELTSQSHHSCTQSSAHGAFMRNKSTYLPSACEEWTLCGRSWSVS